MAATAPIQIFWGQIPEPPPLQTVICERGVHVTTMVDQQLAFTREVGLQSIGVSCSVCWLLGCSSTCGFFGVVTPLLLDA